MAISAMPTGPAKKAQRTFLPVPATEEDFTQAGGDIMKRDPQGRSISVFATRWITFFGVAVDVFDTIPPHVAERVLFDAKYLNSQHCPEN